MTEKIAKAKKIAVSMQCPQCGYHNVKIKEKRYVDFYGYPVVFFCDCGYEKEFVQDSIEQY